MAIRLGRWLMWSVTFPLAPFVAVALIRKIDGSQLTLIALFGSGQLMLTSVALLGNGVRELVSADQKHAGSEFLTWAAAIFLFVIAASYGYIVKDVIIATQHTHQGDVVIASLTFLGISLTVAAASIAVSTPKTRQPGVR